MYISDQFQEFVECMYLKSLDSSTSDAKPSNADVLSWVDQAYKMLKQQKVCNFFWIMYLFFHNPEIFSSQGFWCPALKGLFCTPHDNEVKKFVTMHFNLQKQMEGNQILNYMNQELELLDF